MFCVALSKVRTMELSNALRGVFFLSPLFVGLLLGADALHGQSKKLEKHLKVENHLKAIKIYQKELRKKPEDAMLNYKIAESYRKLNRMHESLPYYQAAFDLGYSGDNLCFKYARSLKADGKYTEAEQILTDCLRQPFEDLEEKRRMEVYLHGMKQLHHLEADHVDTHYTVSNLSGINEGGCRLLARRERR